MRNFSKPACIAAAFASVSMVACCKSQEEPIPVGAVQYAASEQEIYQRVFARNDNDPSQAGGAYFILDRWQDKGAVKLFANVGHIGFIALPVNRTDLNPEFLASLTRRNDPAEKEIAYVRISQNTDLDLGEDGPPRLFTFPGNVAKLSCFFRSKAHVIGATGGSLTSGPTSVYGGSQYAQCYSETQLPPKLQAVRAAQLSGERRNPDDLKPEEFMP